MNHNQRVGFHGEDAVVDYLQKQLFIICARNYRCRGGEVDIIAQKDNCIVFVEVKTRNSSIIDPKEVITRDKQQKIFVAAQRFIQANNEKDVTFQFDVACVYPLNGSCKIEYISNAFSPDEQYSY